MMRSLQASPVLDFSPYAAPAQDLRVQTFHDDERWHRRAIDGRTTACGLRLPPHNGLALRWEKYEGALCPDCFTPYELKRAATPMDRLVGPSGIVVAETPRTNHVAAPTAVPWFDPDDPNRKK